MTDLHRRITCTSPRKLLLSLRKITCTILHRIHGPAMYFKQAAPPKTAVFLASHSISTSVHLHPFSRHNLLIHGRIGFRFDRKHPRYYFPTFKNPTSSQRARDACVARYSELTCRHSKADGRHNMDCIWICCFNALLLQCCNMWLHT